MLILGIETSCDETAAAIVKNGTEVVKSTVATQIAIHKPYSGVVPELASRAHVELLNAVVEKTLKRARMSPRHLDALAVTVGPGLIGSLLVGKMAAEALGWAWGLPVYGVNHIEGHLLSAILQYKTLQPPFLGLVVSGGHTELIVAKKWGGYYLLGRTRDDAAGEAFDKVAKMMSLEYPGGPVIDRLAKSGDPGRYPLPVPHLSGNWDFSFSGLKTAVLYLLRKKKTWTLAQKADICASFQYSVVRVLVAKTLAAAQALGMKNIVVGGGVAANSALRSELNNRAKKLNINVFMAPPQFCTDNASMVASAAFFKRHSLHVQSQFHMPALKNPPPFKNAL